ncbi:hypothetical protein OSTOST_07348 [Ostertagia ostertagi]
MTTAYQWENSAQVVKSLTTTMTCSRWTEVDLGVDIFIDYARDGHGEVIASSDRLVLSRVFSDPKWSQNRAVTGIAFSEQHPELVAVSYDFNKDIPSEPPGVVLIWNTKFKKDSPEYVFHCQSRLASVALARFHAHLIMAGCYSGQICMWDNRVANKKTPIHKVSISTDGKMCSWNVDNLTQPVDGKELLSNGEKENRSRAYVCLFR